MEMAYILFIIVYHQKGTERNPWPLNREQTGATQIGLQKAAF